MLTKSLPTKNTLLAKLMFQPLGPSEFCTQWVPQKTGKQPGEQGYRKACKKLLAELTGYGENTINNWLTYPDECPDLVKRYLRAVDILWKIIQTISIPNWLIKK